MENKELNIEIVNAWLKEQYGMSYDELAKEFNKAVDMFSEKCQELKELRKEIEKLENKEKI